MANDPCNASANYNDGVNCELDHGHVGCHRHGGVHGKAVYWFDDAPHEVFALHDLLRVGFMANDFAAGCRNSRENLAYNIVDSRRAGLANVDVTDFARVSDAALAFAVARHRTVITTFTGVDLESAEETIARTEREGLPDPDRPLSPWQAGRRGAKKGVKKGKKKLAKKASRR